MALLHKQNALLHSVWGFSFTKPLNEWAEQKKKNEAEHKMYIHLISSRYLYPSQSDMQKWFSCLFAAKTISLAKVLTVNGGAYVKVLVCLWLFCVAVELSKILPERPSFVSSENKEVFVPSQLSGLIQEPEVQLSSERWASSTKTNTSLQIVWLSSSYLQVK